MSNDRLKRLEELETWRVTRGLSPEEAEERRRLLADRPQGDDDPSYDLAAAALELAYNPRGEDLPSELKRRLLKDAERFFADSAAVPTQEAPGAQAPLKTTRLRRPPVRSRTSPLAAWLGWAVAAAMLVGSLAVWRPAVPTSSTAFEERRQLLAEDPQAVMVEWKATDDPASQAASGDIVWSQSRQSGYLRIQGLQANDPDQSQYQLWIFDRTRDARFPVDGGVFNVPAEGEEVVIPVRPPLKIGDAHLFAVTVEQPGGVVVSSRGRIVLLADRDG